MSKDENQIRKQLQRLAVQECANYMDGMCVEEDRPCHVLLPQYTIHDGAIGCDYFLEAVLPLDKEMNRVVWAKIDEPHWAPWIVEENAETGAASLLRMRQGIPACQQPAKILSGLRQSCQAQKRCSGSAECVP